MIWPNGEVRQILGDFRVSDLLRSRGGKVMVGTDENGVQNERSASILGQYLGDLAMKPNFAPLHIERWASKLYRAYKQSIIRDVEEKFIYPAETIQLTRDWILRTVNNRWRAFKSKLKKQYFNPQERSLDEIMKGKPADVNEHQWSALVGIWCEEKHMRLCATNSRCANEQKNPHTTGRKSHAKLKKEMEEQKKGKVHRIELWDKAHMKKDGRYANHNVQIVMDTSFDELAKRKKQNNGNISAEDYDEVFDNVIAKESKPRGYYDDKYWSQVQVSQGLPFVRQTANEVNHYEIEGVKNQIELMCDKVDRIGACLKRKFPGEVLITEMVASKNDTGERVDDNDIHRDSNDSDEHASDYNIEESSANAQPPKTIVQSNTKATKTNKGYANSSSPHESMAARLNIENRSKGDKGYAGLALPREDLRKLIQGSQNKKSADHSRPVSDQKQVYLMSQRHENRPVAKGNLVATDSTHVVGGNMLGYEYVAVAVHVVSDIGDENLPRPFENIRTVRDAIGYVIAWPPSRVKRPKSSTPRRA
ncbi:uncharacterized protein C2845_PM05G17360 [Panicum miliaceum]|uniref:Transposase Tnp1/En/Spm-like domain-containing protein n=1 Tax=Panicum miliaceum TaxID=4540 RepID=A0A3L6SWU1_PANMI|nr:uncharacterized protein C2845_PM05G17360 [Panicum miliaceum]